MSPDGKAARVRTGPFLQLSSASGSREMICMRPSA